MPLQVAPAPRPSLFLPARRLLARTEVQSRSGQTLLDEDFSLLGPDSNQ